MAASEAIAAIEIELELWCPGRWRRLTTVEMRVKRLANYAAGWNLDLEKDAVRLPEVTHFILVIDAGFPNTQPRVYAPDMGSDYRWPHVELHGLLCLRPTSVAAPMGDRVRMHLNDALELLNFSDEKCSLEFEREFGSYWAHLATPTRLTLSLVSLVTLGGESRQVYFWINSKGFRLVVADTKQEAKAWIENAGSMIRDRDLLPGLLMRMKKPWRPTEFPKTVGEALHGIPDAVVRSILLPNQRSLILFEAATPTGPAIAAVLIDGWNSGRIANGFRSLAHVPFEHIKRATAQRRVQRLIVNRANAGWIHGRGHSHDQAELSVRRVAIVGCGSVGSEIAELLAKAGVGELTFVDGDDLETANVGRHLLGIGYLGWNKAKGVATVLRRRLPHLKIGSIYQTKFERLNASELNRLAAIDMIVTAGLDIEGEAVVNAWRRGLERPPIYLSTWVEAYAIVGHAVLLYGESDLMSHFEGEQPAFRLTDWPNSALPVIVEAGCGNVFQPHGAVDLQPTIAMATRLALDALLGRIPASCRRVWFGERDAVAALGGVAREGFTEVNAMRQIQW